MLFRSLRRLDGRLRHGSLSGRHGHARSGLSGHGRLPTHRHGLRRLDGGLRRGSLSGRHGHARSGLSGSWLRHPGCLGRQRLIRRPVFRPSRIDPCGDAFGSRCRVAYDRGKNFQPGTSAQHTNCRSHKKSATAATGNAARAQSRAGLFPSDKIPVLPGRKCLVHAHFTSFGWCCCTLSCKKHAKISRSFSSIFR